MTVNKRFLEAASKDEALKSEVEHAALEALGEFLIAKGFGEEAAKITETAMTKVAEAHGFRSDEMIELSEDELKAVAGGVPVCLCFVGGGGSGDGVRCICMITGDGVYPDGREFMACSFAG